VRRVPVLAEAGIQLFFNGPESFTPDDRYYIGETPEVKDLFVATGFNSVGIAATAASARWWPSGFSIGARRWTVRCRHPACLAVPGQSTLSARSHVETLGLLYAMHWPYYQYTTARGVRRTPLHDRLLAAGACMGETAGWERPNWYAAPGSTPSYEYSYGRQNWFEACRAECLAVRDRVTLFDQSCFAKFLVQGPGACSVLNRLSTAELDVPIGKIIYTQWLNERGGIEADLTITRLAAMNIWW